MFPDLKAHTNGSYLDYDVEKSRRCSEFLWTSTSPELGDDHYESCLDDLDFLLIVLYSIRAAFKAIHV